VLAESACLSPQSGSSVTLTQNINCLANRTDDAITIGAAGMAVNLNGHKILGAGDTNDKIGVLDNGHEHVTIGSGTIANFYGGLKINGLSSTSYVTRLVVKDVTVTENTLASSDIRAPRQLHASPSRSLSVTSTTG
jgi:hypothetical protein